MMCADTTQLGRRGVGELPREPSWAFCCWWFRHMWGFVPGVGLMNRARNGYDLGDGRPVDGLPAIAAW